MTQQELADKIGVTWEMVSRYERGKSSPFSRINEISEALSTTSSQLLQNDNNASEYKYYEVPLFTSIPKSLSFESTQATFFYTAPKWIYELGTYVFAVESKIIKNNTLELRDGGIVYVAQNKLSESGIYLVKEGNGFIFSNASIDSVGQVVAQEIKFI